jgi:hypothetical protein
MPIQYTKQMLEEAVSKCKSFTQMVTYFGLKQSGGNWAGMKNRVIKNNIDYSHFSRDGKQMSRPAKWNSIEDYDRIWDSNKQINTNAIKNGLIRLGVLKNICSSCGISEWNGKPIKCEMHHKNGNRWDNRLENIYMLCPNCHSQTDNYKGSKNKK